MEATIQRGRDKTLIVVKGEHLMGGVYIFEGNAEAVCEKFSLNELREVLRQAIEQVEALDSEDVPPSYVKIIQEVQAALRNRTQAQENAGPPLSFLDDDLRKLW